MGISVLASDGYKFSMAEAGWPLRRETFYYSHRKGGAQVVPFDVDAVVRSMLPELSDERRAFLTKHQYDPGAGTWAAYQRWEQLEVRAVPKGAIVYPSEPIFSVTGPSALVSWLEPVLLMLNFRIQIATLAKSGARDELERALSVATCDRERELALETLDAVGAPPVAIRVDPGSYIERVRSQAQGLIDVVKEPARIFEVGLRAATCMEQHLLALEGCRAVGVTRTSNVFGAHRLSLIPVGTMGHEHIQRYLDDELAFRAMTERRPERSSYLLDTYDTLKSGLPAAYRLISENPKRGDSIRFDSGDKVEQARIAIAEARKKGLEPVLILEDGLDVELTRTLEKQREELGWKSNMQFYGYGGYLVARTAFSPLTRDRVAAVYKLSQTGRLPTMKFANEANAGKQSVPGRPVVFRRVSASEGPIGIIGQEGEAPPPGYEQLTGRDRPLPGDVAESNARVSVSAATQALIEPLVLRKQEVIASWKG